MIHISASSKVLIFQAILRGLDFLLLMEEILHQLRLVVYPIIYKGFSTIPGGWSPDKSFLPLTQLPPGLTHFGSLEVMPGTEPKMRGRKAAKTPSQRFYLRGPFGGVFFISLKFSTKNPHLEFLAITSTLS